MEESAPDGPGVGTFVFQHETIMVTGGPLWNCVVKRAGGSLHNAHPHICFLH